MQQQHRRANTRSCFVVADSEDVSLDLLDWSKPTFGSFGLLEARLCGIHERHFCCDDAHRSRSQKALAVVFNVVGHRVPFLALVDMASDRAARQHCRLRRTPSDATGTSLARTFPACVNARLNA